MLLFINALAVLNEERFLKKIGWAYDSTEVQMDGSPPGAKAKMAQVLHAIRLVARIPLIVVNVVVILFELVLG